MNLILIALVRLKQKEARFHSETALSNQQVKKKRNCPMLQTALGILRSTENQEAAPQQIRSGWLTKLIQMALR